MSWLYYDRRNQMTTKDEFETAIIADADGRETVGAAQLEIMMAARRSASGKVVMTHGREQNARRLAARRLVQRGLLAGPNFLGRPTPVRTWRQRSGSASGVHVYTLTERGRSCWLRTWVKEGS